MLNTQILKLCSPGLVKSCAGRNLYKVSAENKARCDERHLGSKPKGFFIIFMGFLSYIVCYLYVFQWKELWKKGKNSPHVLRFFVWENAFFSLDLFRVLHVVNAGSSLITYIHTQHLGSSLLITKLNGFPLLTSVWPQLTRIFKAFQKSRISSSRKMQPIIILTNQKRFYQL